MSEAEIAALSQLEQRTGAVMFGLQVPIVACFLAAMGNPENVVQHPDWAAWRRSTVVHALDALMTALQWVNQDIEQRVSEQLWTRGGGSVEGCEDLTTKLMFMGFLESYPGVFAMLLQEEHRIVCQHTELDTLFGKIPVVCNVGDACATCSVGNRLQLRPQDRQTYLMRSMHGFRRRSEQAILRMFQLLQPYMNESPSKELTRIIRHASRFFQKSTSRWLNVMDFVLSVRTARAIEQYFADVLSELQWRLIHRLANSLSVVPVIWVKRRRLVDDPEWATLEMAGGDERSSKYLAVDRYVPLIPYSNASSLIYIPLLRRLIGEDTSLVQVLYSKLQDELMRNVSATKPSEQHHRTLAESLEDGDVAYRRAVLVDQMWTLTDYIASTPRAHNLSLAATAMFAHNMILTTRPTCPGDAMSRWRQAAQTLVHQTGTDGVVTQLRVCCPMLHTGRQISFVSSVLAIYLQLTATEGAFFGSTRFLQLADATWESLTVLDQPEKESWMRFHTGRYSFLAASDSIPGLPMNSCLVEAADEQPAVATDPVYEARPSHYHLPATGGLSEYGTRCTPQHCIRVTKGPNWVRREQFDGRIVEAAELDLLSDDEVQDLFHEANVFLLETAVEGESADYCYVTQGCCYSLEGNVESLKVQFGNVQFSEVKDLHKSPNYDTADETERLRWRFLVRCVVFHKVCYVCKKLVSSHREFGYGSKCLSKPEPLKEPQFAAFQQAVAQGTARIHPPRYMLATTLPSLASSTPRQPARPLTGVVQVPKPSQPPGLRQPLPVVPPATPAVHRARSNRADISTPAPGTTSSQFWLQAEAEATRYADVATCFHVAGVGLDTEPQQIYRQPLADVNRANQFRPAYLHGLPAGVLNDTGCSLLVDGLMTRESLDCHLVYLREHLPEGEVGTLGLPELLPTIDVSSLAMSVRSGESNAPSHSIQRAVVMTVHLLFEETEVQPFLVVIGILQPGQTLRTEHASIPDLLLTRSFFLLRGLATDGFSVTSSRQVQRPCDFANELPASGYGPGARVLDAPLAYNEVVRASSSLRYRWEAVENGVQVTDVTRRARRLLPVFLTPLSCSLFTMPTFLRLHRRCESSPAAVDQAVVRYMGHGDRAPVVAMPLNTASLFVLQAGVRADPATAKWLPRRRRLGWCWRLACWGVLLLLLMQVLPVMSSSSSSTEAEAVGDGVTPDLMMAGSASLTSVSGSRDSAVPPAVRADLRDASAESGRGRASVDSGVPEPVAQAVSQLQSDMVNPRYRFDRGGCLRLGMIRWRPVREWLIAWAQEQSDLTPTVGFDPDKVTFRFLPIPAQLKRCAVLAFAYYDAKVLRRVTVEDWATAVGFAVGDRESWQSWVGQQRWSWDQRWLGDDGVVGEHSAMAVDFASSHPSALVRSLASTDGDEWVVPMAASPLVLLTGFRDCTGGDVDPVVAPPLELDVFAAASGRLAATVDGMTGTARPVDLFLQEFAARVLRVQVSAQTALAAMNVRVDGDGLHVASWEELASSWAFVYDGLALIVAASDGLVEVSQVRSRVAAMLQLMADVQLWLGFRAGLPFEVLSQWDAQLRPFAVLPQGHLPLHLLASVQRECGDALGGERAPAAAGSNQSRWIETVKWQASISSTRYEGAEAWSNKLRTRLPSITGNSFGDRAYERLADNVVEVQQRSAAIDEVAHALGPIVMSECLPSNWLKELAHPDSGSDHLNGEEMDLSFEPRVPENEVGDFVLRDELNTVEEILESFIELMNDKEIGRGRLDEFERIALSAFITEGMFVRHAANAMDEGNEDKKEDEDKGNGEQDEKKGKERTEREEKGGSDREKKDQIELAMRSTIRYRKGLQRSMEQVLRDEGYSESGAKLFHLLQECDEYGLRIGMTQQKSEEAADGGAASDQLLEETVVYHSGSFYTMVGEGGDEVETPTPPYLLHRGETDTAKSLADEHLPTLLEEPPDTGNLQETVTQEVIDGIPIGPEFKEWESTLREAMREWLLPEAGLKNVTKLPPISVTLLPGAPQFIKLQRRNYKPAQEKAILKQIAEWEEYGHIRLCHNPRYLFPFVTTPKKTFDSEGNLKIRVCIDYRQLNENVAYLPTAMAPLNKYIDRIANSSFISTFDVRSAFQQQALEESSQTYFGMVSPDNRVFVACRSMFGYINSAQCFQHGLMNLLGKDFRRFITYADDVTVSSWTEADHVRDVIDLLKIFHRTGIVLSPEKIVLFASEVEVLGRNLLVSFAVGPTEDNLAKCHQLLEKRPTSISDIKSAMGILNWSIRSFVAHADVLFHPLSRELKRMNGLMTQEVANRVKHYEQKYKTRISPDRRNIITAKVRKEFKSKKTPISDEAWESIQAVLRYILGRRVALNLRMHAGLENRVTSAVSSDSSLVGCASCLWQRSDLSREPRTGDNPRTIQYIDALEQARRKHARTIKRKRMTESEGLIRHQAPSANCPTSHLDSGDDPLLTSVELSADLGLCTSLWQLISVTSHTFSDTERRWPVAELEFFSIVRSCKEWYDILRLKHFRIYTDSAAIATLSTNATAKLRRWLIALADLRFEIVHCPGVNLILVDFLSRFGHPSLQERPPARGSAGWSASDHTALDTPEDFPLHKIRDGHSSDDQWKTLKYAGGKLFAFWLLVAEGGILSRPMVSPDDSTWGQVYDFNMTFDAEGLPKSFVLARVSTPIEEYQMQQLATQEGWLEAGQLRQFSAAGALSGQVREDERDVTSYHEQSAMYSGAQVISEASEMTPRVPLPILFNRGPTVQKERLIEDDEQMDVEQQQGWDEFTLRSLPSWASPDSCGAEMSYLGRALRSCQDAYQRLLTLYADLPDDEGGAAQTWLDDTQARVVKHSTSVRRMLWVTQGKLRLPTVEFTRSSSQYGSQRYAVYVPAETLSEEEKTSGKLTVRQILLLLAHDLTGCSTKAATIKVLHRHGFHWEGMTSDVRRHISTCVWCALKRRSARHTQPQVLRHLRYRGLCWVVDVCGPVEFDTVQAADATTKMSLLVCYEAISRYVEIIPILHTVGSQKKAGAAQDISSERLAEAFFYTIICRHGVPERISNDGAANLTGAVWEGMCEALSLPEEEMEQHVSQSNTISTHGGVEFMNKEVMRLLRCFVRNNVVSWRVYLPLVQMVLNSTPRGVLGGLTANHLLYGLALRIPISLSNPIARGEPIAGMERTRRTLKYAEVYEGFERLRDNVAMARHLAQEGELVEKRRVAAAQQRSNNRRERLAEDNLQPGQSVMVYLPNQGTHGSGSGKIQHPWKTGLEYVAKGEGTSSWVKDTVSGAKIRLHDSFILPLNEDRVQDVDRPWNGPNVDALMPIMVTPRARLPNARNMVEIAEVLRHFWNPGQTEPRFLARARGRGVDDPLAGSLTLSFDELYQQGLASLITYSLGIGRVTAEELQGAEEGMVPNKKTLRQRWRSPNSQVEISLPPLKWIKSRFKVPRNFQHSMPLRSANLEGDSCRPQVEVVKAKANEPR